MTDENSVAPLSDAIHATRQFEAFYAALDELVEATMRLSSAVARNAFDEGARLRTALERALQRAHELAELLPDGAERAEALRQLGEMHGIVTRLLMIAPAPSEAAIAASEAGDCGLLLQEEQAWIANRLSRGTAPPPTVVRRQHRPTPPACPYAFAARAGCHSDDMGSTSEPQPSSASAPVGSGTT